jgi:hypothetical protein
MALIEPQSDSTARACEWCGTPLARKIHPGRRPETASAFRRRRFCANACSKKAFWKQQTPDQRRVWVRRFKIAARKRWTPEERRRVAEKQTKPEDYKRGYSTGWAACERFYRHLLQQQSGAGA